MAPRRARAPPVAAADDSESEPEVQPTRRTRAPPTTSAADLDAELDRLDSERLTASLALLKPWHPSHALSDLPRDIVRG